MRLKGWGQGVNKDQPPWELAPGVWSDCSNMRFRSGRAQRVGGIASVITPTNVPYFLLPYSSGATRYVFYAGLTKAYVHDGSSETEITRTTSPAIKTISAASKAAGVVTIQTASAHGLSTGDIVAVSGFGSGAANRGFNKANATITVVDATHFTYTTTAGDTSTATSIGQYSLVYYSAGVTSNFTGAIDDKWTGGNYNGVIYTNNPVNGLFYWDESVTGKLHAFPDSSVTIQDAVRAFKNYIFLLAPTTGGVKYRHRVQWSQSADPGSVPLSFTAAATNDAGSQDLVSDGEMVDAREWGDVLFIYKRDCRFTARFIGGQFVFDFQLASGNHKDDGLLAANCVVNTPKGQVFLTDGHDVRIHTGAESQSIAFGRMLDYLKSGIDTTYRKRSFLSVNPPFNEVWICYPKSGQSLPSEALIWNWEDDTWGIRALTNVSCGAAGDYPTSIANDARMLLANTTPKIGLVDSGSTDFGSSYTSTLERTGLDFGTLDFKMITKSAWLWKGSTAFTGSAYHGSAKTQDGDYAWTPALTYTHKTSTWLNGCSGSAPFQGIKWSFSPSDTPSLVTIDIEGDGIKVQGKY
jgi:hypothetical protein